MTREWKPGDIAVVECSDGEWRRATCEPHPNYTNRLVWRFHDRVFRYVDNPSDARPLVVIDPEDREQAERLVRAFWNNGDDDCNDPKAMQAALRSLIGPERPAEPMDLGAVVEDDRGRRYTRTTLDDDHPWFSPRRSWVNWGSISAVKVLSEGVSNA